MQPEILGKLLSVLFCLLSGQKRTLSCQHLMQILDQLLHANLLAGAGTWARGTWKCGKAAKRIRCFTGSL